MERLLLNPIRHPTKERAMKCSQVMQPYTYRCWTKDTALECARMMRDHDLRILPVTDEQGCVVGVITDRDLVVRLLANERSPHTKMCALVTMDRLIACAPDDDLKIALDRMFEAKLPRVLVIDEDRRCVGVISISDVARTRGGPDQVFRLLYAMDSRSDLHPPAHPTPSPDPEAGRPI